MLAEKALKDMHNAMLEKRYDDAMDHAYKAVECMNEVCIAIHEERRNVRKASTGA